MLLKLVCELTPSDDTGLIVDPSASSDLRHHEDDEATHEPEEQEVRKGECYFSEVNTHLEIREEEESASHQREHYHFSVE